MMKGAFDAHMRIHSEYRPYKCKHCDKTYYKKGGLDQHILYNHTKKRPKFECKTCGKSYCSKQAMQDHEHSHTGEEKRFKCNVCDKSFNQKQFLVRHSYIHTGKNPHKCEHCDKAFPTKTKLAIHVRANRAGERFSNELAMNKVMTSVSPNQNVHVHE